MKTKGEKRKGGKFTQRENESETEKYPALFSQHRSLDDQVSLAFRRGRKKKNGTLIKREKQAEKGRTMFAWTELSASEAQSFIPRLLSWL